MPSGDTATQENATRCPAATARCSAGLVARRPTRALGARARLAGSGTGRTSDTRALWAAAGASCASTFQKRRLPSMDAVATMPWHDTWRFHVSLLGITYRCVLRDGDDRRTRDGRCVVDERRQPGGPGRRVWNVGFDTCTHFCTSSTVHTCRLRSLYATHSSDPSAENVQPVWAQHGYQAIFDKYPPTASG